MVAASHDNQEYRKYSDALSTEIGRFDTPLTYTGALDNNLLRQSIQHEIRYLPGLHIIKSDQAKALSHHIASYYLKQQHSIALFSLSETYDDLEDKLGLSIVNAMIDGSYDVLSPLPIPNAHNLKAKSLYYKHLQEYLPENFSLIIYDEFPHKHQQVIQDFFDKLNKPITVLHILSTTGLSEEAIRHAHNAFIDGKASKETVANAVLSLFATLNQSRLDERFIRAFFQQTQLDGDIAIEFCQTPIFQKSENAITTNNALLSFTDGKDLGLQNRLGDILDTLNAEFAGKDTCDAVGDGELHGTYNNIIFNILAIFDNPTAYNTRFGTDLSTDKALIAKLQAFLTKWVFGDLFHCSDPATFIPIGRLVTKILKHQLIAGVALTEEICVDDNSEMKKLRAIAKDNSAILQALYYAMRMAGIGYYMNANHETARHYFIESLAIAYANNGAGQNYNHVSGAYVNIARSYADTPKAYQGIKYNEKALEALNKAPNQEVQEIHRRKMDLMRNIAINYQEDAMYAAYKIQRTNHDLAPIFEYRHKITQVKETHPESLVNLIDATLAYIEKVKAVAPEPAKALDTITELLTNVKNGADTGKYHDENLVTELVKKPIDTNRLDKMLDSLDILNHQEQSLVASFIASPALQHLIETVELLGLALVKYHRYIHRWSTPEGDIFAMAYYFEDKFGYQFNTLADFINKLKTPYRDYRDTAMRYVKMYSDDNDFKFVGQALKMLDGNVAVIDKNYAEAQKIYQDILDNAVDDELKSNAQFSLAYLYTTQGVNGHEGKFEEAFTIYKAHLNDLSGAKNKIIPIDDLYEIRAYFMRLVAECDNLIEVVKDEYKKSSSENADTDKGDGNAS